MKRKLVILTVIALAVMGGGYGTKTAQAEVNKGSKTQQIQIQKQRYYHALGYYKAIWGVAARTVYSPNPQIRKKWEGAVHYLKLIQVNSLNEIHRLTAPPSLVPAGYPPHYSAWLCIHRYEGSWTDSGAPYYGGLQMDYGFMQTYGAELLATKGTADHWTPMEQMWVAEKAYQSRGFYPWPNTARYCHLI